MDNDIRIGKKILIFSHKFKRIIDNESAKYGVTSIQGRIMGFVHRQSKNRNIFQKDIESEFNIRRSSVTSVLQLMEKNELIKRVSVPEDARLKKIILTDKGLEIHKHVHNTIDIIENKIKDEFTKEELDVLVSFIDRLSASIEE